jgi:hypothetical protein
LTPTKSRWLHWHVSSDRILQYSITFSDLWSHHCEESTKKSCHSSSLWPLWTAEKQVPIKLS